MGRGVGERITSLTEGKGINKSEIQVQRDGDGSPVAPERVRNFWKQHFVS